MSSLRDFYYVCQAKQNLAYPMVVLSVSSLPQLFTTNMRKEQEGNAFVFIYF
jgi:hypothetical protein